MNKLLLIALIAVLSGCSNADNKIKESDFVQENLPKELSDCTAYSGASGLTIIRCPNSITSTNFRLSKTNRSVVVIDNTPYEKVDVPKQDDTVMIKGELYKKVENSNE